MGEPVRILLLEIPQLLRDMLAQAIQVHGDCELIKGTKRALELPEQMVSPDVVILGLMAAEDATLVAPLLARWPGAHVMTLAPVGEDVTAYALKPHCRALGQLSPDEVVDSLRAATARRRERLDEFAETSEENEG